MKRRSFLQIQFAQGGSLMRRQLLMASVAAIALTGSAFAADLPSRAPPPAYLPPVPIFSWTGLYLGAQVGYAWGRDSENFGLSESPVIVDTVVLFPGAFINDSFSSSPSGIIGGAHVGYNLQINQWVAGLEGTVDGTGISKSASDPFSGLTVGSRAYTQGSIRARAGIAWDRFLVYATGGAAFTGISNIYTDPIGSVTGAPGASETISRTRAGWTVGGGIEYAITNNWSVRAEYRYSDFGHYTDTPFVAFVAFPGSLGVQHHLTENQVQAGFSYKFDSLAPAPVVARY
jgi:outer membrane immunogenic protein